MLKNVFEIIDMQSEMHNNNIDYNQLYSKIDEFIINELLLKYIGYLNDINTVKQYALALLIIIFNRLLYFIFNLIVFLMNTVN